MTFLFSECHCGCHSGEPVSHVVPCCQLCAYCHVRYKFGYEEHVQDCKAEHLQHAESVLGRKMTTQEQENFLASLVWGSNVRG